MYIIINNNIAVAIKTNTDSIHIRQSDICYETERIMLENNKIIWLSINDISDLYSANKKNIDYISINGVFISKIKNITTHLLCIKKLKPAFSKTKHILVAIGDINENNISNISSLYNRFYIISDICKPKEPVKKIQILIKKINSNIYV